MKSKCLINTSPSARCNTVTGFGYSSCKKENYSPLIKRGLRWYIGGGVLLVIFYILFFHLKPAFAFDLSRPNNIYGIHLAQPDFKDIKATADLVNSAGGSWGYITLVLQEDDRNPEKWQSIFDYLRQLHLIPIIRLATKPQGEYWRKPMASEAHEWAIFLNSLNWVIKNRYVILFNEPNQGREWGGRVDVEDYATVSKSFAEEFKTINPDFFVMLAGLDASAPSQLPFYESEERFLKKVFSNGTIEQWNNILDGLASHSYPGHFTDSPDNWGRGSVRTYMWELDILRSLGIKKELPVFITETGWERNSQLSTQVAANYFRTAFSDIWAKDSRIIAVTPFILNYQGKPFDNFSWQQLGGDSFYSQYYTVQSIAKISADPEFIDMGRIDFDLPKELVVDSSYHFQIHLTNKGQAIWDKNNGYSLQLDTKDNYIFSDIKNLKPDDDDNIDLYFKTTDETQEKDVKISLFKKDKEVLSKIWKFKILALPKLKVLIDLYPKSELKINDFELQIFDPKEQLVYNKKKLILKKNEGFLDGIQNVSYDEKYRVVVLKPYYLPRQQFITFSKNANKLRFELMYPVDFDKNGKFDLKDMWALMINPKLFNLYLP